MCPTLGFISSSRPCSTPCVNVAALRAKYHASREEGRELSNRASLPSRMRLVRADMHRSHTQVCKRCVRHGLEIQCVHTQCPFNGTFRSRPLYPNIILYVGPRVQFPNRLYYSFFLTLRGGYGVVYVRHHYPFERSKQARFMHGGYHSSAPESPSQSGRLSL